MHEKLERKSLGIERKSCSALENQAMCMGKLSNCAKAKRCRSRSIVRVVGWIGLADRTRDGICCSHCKDFSFSRSCDDGDAAALLMNGIFSMNIASILLLNILCVEITKNDVVWFCFSVCSVLLYGFT